MVSITQTKPSIHKKILIFYVTLVLLRCNLSNTIFVTLRTTSDNNSAFSSLLPSVSNTEDKRGGPLMTLSLGISRSDPFQQPASTGASGKLSYILYILNVHSQLDMQEIWKHRGQFSNSNISSSQLIYYHSKYTGNIYTVIFAMGEGYRSTNRDRSRIWI